MKVPRDIAAKCLELSGQTEPAAAKPTRPQATAFVPVRVLVGPVPVKLASEANARGKLRDKIVRKSAVKSAVRATLEGLSPPRLPVLVRLVRVGGKRLDDDNAVRSCKGVRDEVAKWLGVDDADRRVKWVVKQQAGYECGVVIDVRTRET